MYTKVWFPRIRYAYNKYTKVWFQMYTKVSFPRIRYAYNKCIPKFDFLE